MKSLKITLLLAIALVSFNTACAQWGNEKIRGNGDVTTITRTTSDYDDIKLAGWMDFKLVKGTEGKRILSRILPKSCPRSCPEFCPSSCTRSCLRSCPTSCPTSCPKYYL